MSLRDQLIEACVTDVKSSFEFWNEDVHDDLERYVAVNVLDAVLDTLTEHADEWWGQTYPGRKAHELLAVLREDT